MSKATAQLQKLVAAEVSAFDREPTDASKVAAKRVVENDESSASALYLATRIILSPDFVEYEPDTLWMLLDVPLINRDKLHAALAMHNSSDFYIEPRVFGAIAQTLTGDVPQIDQMPHPTIFQMAWAAWEGEVLYALTSTDAQVSTPEYTIDVATYVAIGLFDAGYALAPEGLRFAQEALEKLLSPAGLKLSKETAAAYHEKPDALGPFENSALGVQLSRQAAVSLYLTKRAEVVEAELKAL